MYPDGVRAARADTQVDYWLAMSSAHSYPYAGALSPDGTYFAYPVGETNFYINLVSHIIGVDNVRIVRTDGRTDETYLIPATGTEFVSDNTLYTPGLDIVKWFGLHEVFYTNYAESRDQMLYDFLNDAYMEWSDEPNLEYSFAFSPDSTRTFTHDDSLEYDIFDEFASYRFFNVESQEMLDYAMPDNLAWFADSSAFLASTEDGLVLMDRDAQQIDFISTDQAPTFLSIAPNQQAFAYWNQENRLFIANLGEQVVYDMCLERPSKNMDGLARWRANNLAWSPDGNSLAFGYDDYLVILDLETLHNRVYDTPSRWVMRWATLEGETFEPTIPAFDWPTTTPTPIPTATLVPTATPEPTVTVLPTATLDPATVTCQLDVVVGANLRAGAGAHTERVGSAAEGFVLTAVAQQFNEAEYFIWWQLNTGEWIREDFVQEGDQCPFLPDTSEGTE